MNYIYFGIAAFLAGLYAALADGLPAYGSAALCFGMSVCFLLAAVLLKREGLRLAALCLCLLLLGLGRGASLPEPASAALEPYWGRQVILQGRLEPLSLHQSDGYAGFVLDCRSLQQGGTVREYRGRVRVGVRRGEKVPETGELAVAGELQPLTVLRNPGCFDGEAYNRNNNFGGRLKNGRILAVRETADWRDRLALLNLFLKGRLERWAGGEPGAVLSGMLLGGSGGLADETREIFSANGLAHVLSVSGTHLLLLSSLLWLLLRPLPLLWRRLILLAVLGLYAALCGLRAPVLRALLMSAVVLLGGRGAVKGRLLCLTCMALLLYKPLWLTDLSFQLSFASAAGLLWLLPACRRCLPSGLPEFISDGASVALAAQLAAAPLSVGYFHQLTPWAALSNILLLPVLEAAALLALSGLLLPGGEFLITWAGFLVRQLLQQGEWLASLPGSILAIGALPLWCAVLYYAFLLLWADLPAVQFFNNRERRFLLLSLGAALAAALLWQQNRPQPLTAYFLDVGQGDCVVLTGSNGKVIVCDTGGLKSLDTGSRIVAPFLRSLGKDSVDVLLLSHYDFDHAGGAPGLLRQLRVREIVLPRERAGRESGALYEQLMQAAAGRRCRVLAAAEGLSWALGENAYFRILSVPAAAAAGNEASTAAGVYSPYASLLLTGDLEGERERAQRWERHTLLKVGHHGSKNSSSEEFLQQVRPVLTLISCGRDNRYGHPHAETLQRLQAAGSRIARTDRQGCLRVVMGEEGVSCRDMDGTVLHIEKRTDAESSGDFSQPRQERLAGSGYGQRRYF